MRIHTEGFSLDLRAARRRDDEDWARVAVSVEAAGFAGEFAAWIQVDDLRRFSAEVAGLYDSIGQRGEAHLVGAEPDIDIQLNMNASGHIDGTYALESKRIDGVPTVLSGRFEADQSYLPELRRSINALIAELMP